MLESDKRFIGYWDSRILAYPFNEGLPITNASALAEALVNLANGNLRRKYVDKQAAAFLSADFRIDVSEDGNDKFLVMLIQYADKRISEPDFQDLETGDVRHIMLKKGEGVALSAHVVIKLEHYEMIAGADQMATGYTLPTVIEEIPGLSAGRLSHYINYLLKESLSRIKPIVNDRDLKYWPKVKFEGYANETLGNATSTQRGKQRTRIGEVTFTSTTAIELDDTDPHYKVVEKNLVVRAQDVNPGRLKWLEDLTRKMKLKGYEKTKIRMLHRDDDGKLRQQSVYASSVEDLANSVKFQKRELIHLEEPINQCNAKIHEELVSCMKMKFDLSFTQ